MDETFDPEEAILRWKAGSEAAASELIEHLYPLVSRIVRTHLPRRESEEDLIQDIFVKIFARSDQYKGAAPFTHWVSRLALTTCLDRLRAHRVRPEFRWSELMPEDMEILNLAASAEEPKRMARALQARDVVDKLLATLSAEDRSLILMVDLEGSSLQDIASLTGWSLSKIKMRLVRCRAQLRKLLEKWGEQP